jgi:hypothetical protein
MDLDHRTLSIDFQALITYFGVSLLVHYFVGEGGRLSLEGGTIPLMRK